MTNRVCQISAVFSSGRRLASCHAAEWHTPSREGGDGQGADLGLDVAVEDLMVVEVREAPEDHTTGRAIEEKEVRSDKSENDYSSDIFG